MSLTSFISIEEINEKFKETFTMPTFDLKDCIKCPSLTNNYSLIGTAFDYLFRFIIERENLGVNVVKKDWVCEIAIEDFAGNKKQLKLAKETLEETRMLYEQYLKNGVLDKKLIKNSLILAQTDVSFRAGIVDDNFGKIEERDIEDLENLIKIIPKNLFKANKFCVLNPTFGKGSEIVGGADADLIIDNTLIDVKTVKDLTLQRKYLHQLIGYYVLNEIGNIDGVKQKVEIERLGIYFGRHGILYTFNLKDALSGLDMPKFIKWFKNQARFYF